MSALCQKPDNLERARIPQTSDSESVISSDCCTGVIHNWCGKWKPI